MAAIHRVVLFALLAATLLCCFVSSNDVNPDTVSIPNTGTCLSKDAEVDALKEELKEVKKMLRSVHKELRSFLMNDTHFQVPYGRKNACAGTCSECTSICWKSIFKQHSRNIKDVFAPLGNQVIKFNQQIKIKIRRYWRIISEYFSDSLILDFILRKIYTLIYFTKQKFARYARLLQGK